MCTSQLQGPQVGLPHQPRGHCWSILGVHSQVRGPGSLSALCTPHVLQDLGPWPLPVLTVVPEIAIDAVTGIAVGGPWEMPAGALVLTGVQEAGVHAARAIVTCRRGQRTRDTDPGAREGGVPSLRQPRRHASPGPHLASTCRRRSARGLGSQRGAGKARTHRRCPRHSRVPHSLAAWGGAGLGTPKAWSRARPPVDTAGLMTPDVQLPARPDRVSLAQPRGPSMLSLTRAAKGRDHRSWTLASSSTKA